MTISTSATPLLTLEEAAEILGVSVSTMQFLTSQRRRIRYFVVANRVRIAREDLDAFLAANERPTKGESR